jgi:hypothetical protein
MYTHLQKHVEHDFDKRWVIHNLNHNFKKKIINNIYKKLLHFEEEGNSHSIPKKTY